MPERSRYRIVAIVIGLAVCTPFAHAAWHELGALPEGGVLLADRTPYTMLLGFAGLVATLLLADAATPGGMPTRGTPPRRAQLVLLIGVVVTLGVALLLGGPFLRVAMVATGKTRCSALDEMRRGNVARNDRIVHAFVDPTLAPPATLARCGLVAP